MGKSETSLGVKIADKTNDRPSTVKRQAVFSYKQIRWKGKQEKFAETHRADLTIWEAANRYLRANLPDMKLAPKAWQTELAKLTAENEAEYAKLKAQREVVSDLQKIHRYVDIALKEDAPQQSKTRNHNIDR